MKYIYKKILFYLSIFLILLTITYFFNIGYLPLGMIILAFINVYTLFYFIKNRKNKASKAKHNLYIWLLSLAVFFSIYPISSLGRNITKQRAKELINGIELYHFREGHYPTSLEELKNQKIFTKIPRPAFFYANGFFYNPKLCDTVSEKRNIMCSYKLGYYGPLETTAWFDSRDKKWVYED